AGDVFRARINGTLQPLTKQRLTPEQTRSIAETLIQNEADRAALDYIKDYDCSWGAPGIGRFRVNILKQRSSYMIVMRVIPFEVKSSAKLGLPPVVDAMAEAKRGLILVTGMSGSGRSSTLAAMVHHINAGESRHVVTLESPIEFLHRDVNCSITQREVGTDTDSYLDGIRAAMRQDPDVIVIDEVLEAPLARAVLEAVEDGHVVLTSYNTPDVVSTIMRMVALFPQEDRELARSRLADSLHGIVSQRLFPREDGEGQMIAVEVLVVDEAAREMIRDRNRMSELREYMEGDSSGPGTHTLRQHVEDLVKQGVISEASLDAIEVYTDDKAAKSSRKSRRSKAKSA
ncbi:MAG: type IV pilus twitching motility protein PilT, partial [Gemmatimonadales bacterium]